MQKTEKLMQRIKSLESDLAEKIKDREQLEQELSAVYEDGTDASDILKNLGVIKDAISGSVSALKNLDQKLYQVQAAEHESEKQALKEESEKRYVKTLKSIAKALRPVREILESEVSAETLPKLLDRLLDSISEDLWQAIDSESQAAYTSRVPCRPQMPPERDAEGKPIPRALV